MSLFKFFFHLEISVLNVAKATVSITDWSYLALYLGFSEAQLQRIISDHQQVSSHQHKAIITKWLESGKASWAILVSALRDELVNKGAVADEIAKKHIPKVK